MPRFDAREGVDEGLMPRGEIPIDGPSRRTPIPGSGPEFPSGAEKPVPVPRPNYPKGNKPLDINLYATKKTVAQGMMDLALLTANANQLRYVLESGNRNGPYFYVSVSLISFSIFLQLAIGITLIFLGRYNLRQDNHMVKAERLNNWVVLGVFLITTVNVFISSFGIDVVDPILLVNAAIESSKSENSLPAHEP